MDPRSIPGDYLTRLLSARSFVFLTGAGISASSGVPTFRNANDPERAERLSRLSTLDGLRESPHEFHELFNELRRHSIAACPTQAHDALAQLDQKRPDLDIIVITQNVDPLHERAGSHNVIRLHGDIQAVHCMHCGHVMRWSGDLEGDEDCPSCDNRGYIRPDVVLFGEQPRSLRSAEEKINSCQVFCAIGCSLEVYPAADFVRRAKRSGALTVEINPAPASRSDFDLSFAAAADAVVQELVSLLIEMACCRFG